MTYTETDIVTGIERLSGTSLAAMTRAQLDAIDQFHAGGSEAIARLLPHLALTVGTTALDIGSGLGGPARQVARAGGGKVVGVDVTPAYVDAARALSDAAGLAEQTSFFCGDIGSFEPTGFDAAYTVHVQMNVADKRAFYSAIARRLRPGARLAVFEVCRSGDGELPLPLPWSLDGTDSHLVTGEELRDTVQSSGFLLLDWIDETTWARTWFDAFGRRLMAGSAPATLSALLTDGPTRLLNFAAATGAGALSIHRGAFTVPR